MSAVEKLIDATQMSREDCFLQLDGTIVTGVCPTLAERLGYEAEALIGQPLDAVVPAHAEEHLIELLLKFGLHQPLPPTRQVQIKCADGSFVPALARLHAEGPQLSLTFQCLVESSEIDATRRYKDIYETVAEGIYRCSLDGIQMAANPALVRLNGYETEAEMLREVNDIDRKWYVDPNRRAEFFAAIQRDGVVRDFVSEVYRFKTREKIWISENARLVCHPETGVPAFYEGTIREVTAQVTAHEKTESHAKIAAQAPGLLFQSCLKPGPDQKPYFSFASEGCEDLCGLTPDELLADADSFGRRVHPEDRARVAMAVDVSAKSLKPWSEEFRVRRTDGTDIWVSATSTPEMRADGSIVWHGFVTDITERKAAQAQIETLAYQDSLTGLANRARLHDDGERRLQNALGADQSAALLFLDLDNFKSLNDLHGHRAGDDFLKEIAARITKCISSAQLVVRLGGDEFVVLMTDTDLPRAQAAAHRLVLELGQPYSMGDRDHRSTPSIGVAVTDGAHCSINRLLRRADLAMYAAKARGKNCFVVFDESMETATAEVANFQAQVRDAILNDDLEIQIQPLIDASSRKTVGGEALLRLMLPEKGWISPSRIVDAADESGLGRELHLWVMQESLRAIHKWNEQGVDASATMSVNLSPSYLQDDSMVGDVLRLLKQEQIPSHRVVLEITEHGVLDDIENVALKLSLLRAHGLRVALDDFGTGYSCLTYLKKLPITDVKIDRLFVQDMENDVGDQAIVGAVVAVAKQLGLSVTAEGVETHWQTEHLIKIGCDKLQGHAFSKAMPVSRFINFAVGSARGGAEVEVSQKVAI